MKEKSKTTISKEVKIVNWKVRDNTQLENMGLELTIRN